MSIKDINNNPKRLKAWIDNEKAADKIYFSKNPDSVILIFVKELKNLGFEFETNNQILGFMPKYKSEILPIAIKYYQLAREKQKDNEQNYFLNFFQFKGLNEVVPMLIEDYYRSETTELTRWFISDCLYTIRSKEFLSDYINIASNPLYGYNRQMIVLLLGKLKFENTIPLLIDLLEDEEVRLHAIEALSNFKREDFRCHFERFQNSKHPGWRKYAKKALKKLDNK